MNRIIFLVILVVLLIAGFFIFSSSSSDKKKVAFPTPIPSPQVMEEKEKKATFAVFTNGTFRIFTASMYHNLSSDVYIESSNPNVVHVKKSGVTWDDFFKTLPFSLSAECLTTGTGQTFCTGENGTLKFYINGQLDSQALTRVINSGDQMLISYGNETEEEVKQQFEQIPRVE